MTHDGENHSSSCLFLQNLGKSKERVAKSARSSTGQSGSPNDWCRHFADNATVRLRQVVVPGPHADSPPSRGEIRPEDSVRQQFQSLSCFPPGGQPAGGLLENQPGCAHAPPPARSSHDPRPFFLRIDSPDSSMLVGLVHQRSKDAIHQQMTM